MLDIPDATQDCCPGPVQATNFPDDLQDKAKLFKALGDDVRLKLLHLVRDQEVCVCDLVATLGMAQGTLSHHLAVLQQAGLVMARKQGRWNYYQATALAKSPLGVFATASR
jgi:ArsR family transcriptional regulator